jgi:hypothetical protein
VVRKDRRGISTVLLASAIAVSVYMTLLSTTSAQDLYDCPDFRYQEDAQAIYDQDPSDPYGLDGPPGDAFEGIKGVACEDLPHKPMGGSPESSPSGETSEPTTGAQQRANGSSSTRANSSQSSAIAGGAFAQSSRERQRRNVVKGTVPNRKLAPTGGVPVYTAVVLPVLAGTSLLAVGIVIRHKRGRR